MLIVHTAYQDPINSFPLSTARIGVQKAGRYCGFDTMVTRVAAGDIPVAINHSATGLSPSTTANEVGDTIGAVITPHGSAITSNEDVLVVLSANATSNPRIDVLYLEFIWADENPGNTPTFAILQGTAAAIPVEPELTYPAIRVKLGTFYLAANASNISGVTYTPAPVPLPGGAEILTNFPELDTRYAQLHNTNTFTKTQYWNAAEVEVASGTIHLPETGNTFKVVGDGNQLAVVFIGKAGDIPFQEGTRITLMFENLGPNSFLDGSIDFGMQVFRASGLITTTSGIPTSAFPIKSGDVVDLVYRGTYGGYGTWEILSPISYILTWLHTLNLGVRALQNPTAIPWVEVLESGAGTYCFEPGFTAIGQSRLSYRTNIMGQLEFKGSFSMAYATGFFQKICTINPSYLTNSRPLIQFADVVTGSLVVMNAIIESDGSVKALVPHTGVWMSNSVVSAK